MGAENNVITTEEVKVTRERDYAILFGEQVSGLLDMMGVSRLTPIVAGTTLTQKVVSGTLENGTNIAEGDIIPLSQYEVEEVPIGTAKLDKWRKATTAEAILKSGFDVAVNDTDAKMVRDIQKGIRGQFITSLASGEGVASGESLQEALADAWGQLAVAFEDDDVNAVYFLNPQDVAEYLGKAQITIQNAFGFRYIADFLGLGTVIMNSNITKGTFYATASQNINVLYVNVNEANGLGEAFAFTTDDETGFIGIHEDSNYTRLQSETVAIAGLYIFAEMPKGVIVGTIGKDTP